MEVYDSVSTVAIYRNGKDTMKTQRVKIEKGKGYKEVMMKKNGQRMRKTRKALTKKEIACIRRCKFKKGLFRDCVPDCSKEH